MRAALGPAGQEEESRRNRSPSTVEEGRTGDRTRPVPGLRRFFLVDTEEGKARRRRGAEKNGGAEMERGCVLVQLLLGSCSALL